MTLKELISELTLFAQEKPSWLDEEVYFQMENGNDLIGVSEISCHTEDLEMIEVRKVVLS